MVAFLHTSLGADCPASVVAEFKKAQGQNGGPKRLLA